MTKVVISKIKSKSGPKKRNTLSSQGELLQALWERFGGIVACAEKLGISHQLLVNWKLRNKVPMELVGVISRKLGVPKAALNYEEIVEYEGAGMKWESLVGSLGFSAITAKKILTARHPRSLESILKNK